MGNENLKKHQGKSHGGPNRSSPYPLSRLAPAISLVDVARQIEQADRMVNARVSAKLQVIADQIKALQEEARAVLAEARHDQELHHARCHFQRRPGQIYHLYRQQDGSLYFSMLSPDDWRGSPPHAFQGSYRLETDMSWTPLADLDRPDNTRALLERLLSP
jgi:hypothetical protein